jgi:hypothetical protein
MIVILCDCQEAVLLARRGRTKPGPYWSAAKLLMDLKRRLRRLGFKLLIDWVPGHTGLVENEQADVVAKSAASESRMARRGGREGDLPLPYPTVRFRIRVGANWLESKRFTECVKAAPFLKEVTEGAFPVNLAKVFQKAKLSRRDEICFDRVRTGSAMTNNRLKHGSSGVTSAACDGCSEQPKDSVRHRILECRGYDEERKRLVKEVSKGRRRGDLVLTMELLYGLNGVNERCRVKRVAAVAAFVRRTGLDQLFYYTPGV